MGKKLKVLGIVVGSIALAMVVINVIPPAKVIDENPFITETSLPMIAAHRGGSINDPENTLKAYRNSVANYNIDIVDGRVTLNEHSLFVVDEEDNFYLYQFV
jgi:hypothetical protein